jgi:DAK2 domain fusion protein YloV
VNERLAPSLERVRELARAAAATLEASRRRIDDLNVYPLPDGDTGTNMALTVRAVVDALEESAVADRATLAREITRAALMGARGNSGVILSQIVRGFAEVAGAADHVDARTLAAAFRGASDAAYAGMREPVEGTMLTVARELAEEAEVRSAAGDSPEALLHAVVRRGEEAVARTQTTLDVLRQAGVVDAGAAGLLELVRGIAAAASGEPLPEPPPREELGFEAVHQELSRYRYCTLFVVEGEELDAAALEREFEQLGDSLLVVGDANALKVHLHTDDPGAALSLGIRAGVVEGVEVANMHRQAVARKERLTHPAPMEANRTDVVAVVAGAGNRALYESLGAVELVEGGQSMNPATAEIVAALERTTAPEVIVLPNNSNVLLTADQAASVAQKPVRVVPTRSIQAGLAAMVAFDGSRSADENAAAMDEAVHAVATGAVTTASRDVELNGLRVSRGDYLGLLEGEPVVGGRSFEEVAEQVVERLLAEPRDVLTLLTGDHEPSLEELLKQIEARHPGLELEVQAGGQPHYQLLLSAE